MMRTMGIVMVVAAGCAAPVTGSGSVDSVDDPLSSDGKADAGDQWCDLQSASVSAQFTTINIGVNVCHERGVSARLEVGLEARGRVAHEEMGDTVSVGCTTWHGELDVNYGMEAEGHLFRIPVSEGQRVYATVGTSSRAKIDILERVRWSESTSELKFNEAGLSVDVTDDGGDSLVHEKDGERFVVVRVRPGQICPGANGVDYELTVTDSPASEWEN